MGAWCASESSSPTLCQAGTYLNSTGNDAIGDCIPCTMGMYCAGSGNEVPDGYCSAGWYCDGGDDTSTPPGQACTVGHYCPEGSIVPVVCDPGFYQDAIQQSTCIECPAGYYCDTASAPVSDYSSAICSTGNIAICTCDVI